MSEFSHVEDDRIRMVDLTEKVKRRRRAVARGTIDLRRSTVEAIEAGTVEKGNVLTTARIAGIQAAKRTAEDIPLCHHIPLTSVTVDFEAGETTLEAEVEVKTTARTGVEMEALNGVTRALLTVWDMVKSVEKDEDGQYPHTRIGDVNVVEKVKRAPSG